LMKIQKKADAINDTEDISEKEKSINIAKLLAKAAGAKNKKPKKEVKLVVAKGQNRGAKGRPKGVKGRYVFWFYSRILDFDIFLFWGNDTHHPFFVFRLLCSHRYKMVDSRMKKEMRATKRIAKKAKGSNRKK